MTSRALFISAFMLTSFSTMLPNALGQGLVIGVLEEHKGHYVGEPKYRAVRAVFKKEGNEWRAFQNDCQESACLKTSTSTYPSEVSWTIAFSGKKVGQVTSRTPKDFAWYASIGEQEITSIGPVPIVGPRSTEFGGYADDSVYRPLVAISQAHFKDPDGWSPSSVSPALTTTLRLAFRKTYPKLCRWTDPNNGKLVPWSYADKDVKVRRSYASKSGWAISRLHLEAVDCTNDEAGDFMDDPWFVVDPKGSVAILDSGMWLVDAGDYDNDGRSELIFSISRDNRGGYELFYDDFKKRVAFEFGYH